MSNAFSNTVGVSNKNSKEKSIYVNPISDMNGNNYCIELHEYIHKLPIILRRDKLNNIFNI